MQVILDVPGTDNTSNPGFDHNLVISTSSSSSVRFRWKGQVADYNGRYIQPQIQMQIQMEDQVRPVAEVEYNGLYMLVRSNQPGVQFYTGNFLPRLAFLDFFV